MKNAAAPSRDFPSLKFVPAAFPTTAAAVSHIISTKNDDIAHPLLNSTHVIKNPRNM